VNYKQDNWANWIAEAEFQYNDKQHSTTGFSFFYLNYRHYPWKGDRNRSTTIPKVQRFIQELDKARRKAQQAIDRRNKELKTKINKGRKTKTYTNCYKLPFSIKSIIYFSFLLLYFSIYSMRKYVTPCDRESDKVTSKVTSHIMSHMTLVGCVG